MTNLLIRLFIKNYENTKEARVRAAYGNLAGWVGIVCNILLCAFKMTIGLLSGSLSIAADGVNNLSDASSNIISLIGFKLGSRPPDPEHPYGHARYEYLAGLVVAVMIMVIGVNIGITSIKKIRNPEEVAYSGIVVIVLVISILIKIWMAFFQKKIGHRITSETLIATSADSRNDVITTSAVLIASVVEHYTGLSLDGWMGLAVAVFIRWSGVTIVKDTLDPILGKAPSPEFVRHIQEKILSYEGVLGAHDLMIHDYGPGRLFASVHVEMAAEKSPLDSHRIIDKMEKDIFEEEGMELVIHYDPVVTSESCWDEEEAEQFEMRNYLTRVVTQINADFSVHDVRIEEEGQIRKVYFDCMIPQDFPQTDRDVRHQIRDMVQSEHEELQCVITIDRSFVTMPHTHEDEDD